MASAISVLVAGLMHLCIRFVILKEAPKQLDTPGSSVPSFIVCLALMDLIYDNRLVPLGLYGTSKWTRCLKLICESAIAIVLLEVGALVIWNSLEFSVYIIVQTLLLGLDIVSLETYQKHEALIIGAFTSFLALSILAIANHATQRLNICYRSYRGLKTHVTVHVDDPEFINQPEVYVERKLEDALSKYNTPLWQTYSRKHT